MAKQKAARERRMKRHERDAALGRKKGTELLAEEAVQETIDWVERGGLARFWRIIKVAAFILVALAIMGLVAIISA